MEVIPDFRLSEQKLREGTWVADKLHRTMRESAYGYGWTFVETHRRAFIDRGVCAGILGDGKSIADELRLPRKIERQVGALQSGGLPRLCHAPALVPHAQRRLHDGQFPRLRSRCCRRC